MTGAPPAESYELGKRRIELALKLEAIQQVTAIASAHAWGAFDHRMAGDLAGIKAAVRDAIKFQELFEGARRDSQTQVQAAVESRGGVTLAKTLPERARG